MTQSSESSGRWLVCGLVALGALVFLSFYLGWTRIIQVDEAERMMIARIIGKGRSHDFMAAAPLMILGPITWLARAATSSADLFHQVRILFVGLMWVNVLLMVKATGVRLRSPEGLGLLLLGATLEPLWDYGFEIRHDNVLLTGLLGMWLLLRPSGRVVPRAYLLAGTLAAVLQFVAFKAFLYTVPILVLFLVVPGRRQATARSKAAAELLAGVLAGLLLCWFAHRLAGTWHLFAGGVQSSARQSISQVNHVSPIARMAPWPTLYRLLLQTPLLVGGAIAVLLAPLAGLAGPWREDLSSLLRKPHFPEWAMLLVAIGVLTANPTPFPYNLVLLVPFMFVAVARHRRPLVRALRDTRRGCLAWSMLISGHVLPWMTSTPRHFEMSNERQMTVIDLAEKLTDPARHRVFDGSGLVPTRDPLGYYWLIHTFTIRPMSDGTWPSVRSQLAAHEVPVILPSYRTNSLPRQDQDFIAANYLALAQDFLVLGARMEGGEGQWTALSGGNYFLALQGGTPADVALEVDGKSVSPGPIRLERRLHQFHFPPGRALVVVWTGPRGGEPPSLPGTRMPLFLNWY